MTPSLIYTQIQSMADGIKVKLLLSTSPFCSYQKFTALNNWPVSSKQMKCIKIFQIRFGFKQHSSNEPVLAINYGWTVTIMCDTWHPVTLLHPVSRSWTVIVTSEPGHSWCKVWPIVFVTQPPSLAECQETPGASGSHPALSKYPGCKNIYQD